MATSSAKRAAPAGTFSPNIVPLFPRTSEPAVIGPGWAVIGKDLQRARRSYGVSQTMFASITGVSVSTIGRIERGRITRRPRSRTVLLILGGLHMCGAVEAYRRVAS
jgi:hypothetical protein